MSDRIDAYVSQPHYAEHVLPVLAAIPDELRGDLYAAPNIARELDGPVKWGSAPNSSMPLLVGTFQDLVWSRRPKVLVNHGAGQTYNGVVHGSYAGGPGHEQADLFICPNERVAQVERDRYPNARAVAVGCPKLDAWARIPRPHNDPPVIAVTFHWQAWLHDEDGKPVPEAGWAFDTWKDTIADLAKRGVTVLGHGHPRAQRWLRAHWNEMGVEYVPRAVDLLSRADCLVLDNSSLGFEWAALDRPTVWLRGEDWRPDDVTGHGLRFGEPLPGPELGAWAAQPEMLNTVASAINTSMQLFVLARAEVRARVYGKVDGLASRRAADAVLRLAGVEPVASAP